MAVALKENVFSENGFENFEEIWRNGFKSEFQKSEFISVKGVRFPEEYAKVADLIENFEIRDDDVWVCTFPKSGTTWTQEMVWCLANDVDLEGAKQDLFERFPFFELPGIFDPAQLPEEFSQVRGLIDETLQYYENLESPRFLKTHLPFHLLPRDLREGKTKAKMIYVRRNPKDTCISYYHQYRRLHGYEGDFNLFCELFMGDKCLYCPYWDHILGFWNRRNDPKLNILLLQFEDMKSDLSSIIQKTSEFLGKPSLSPENLEILLDHLSFSKMKNNPAVNKDDRTSGGKFMRCGEVNQWKAVMTPEMSEKFDKWSLRHLKSSDLTL